ncbi:MAG: alpha/beta fold hydrolase [Hyphomonadaceae bacterium]
MPFGQIEALEQEHGKLAYERIPGARPTFVWLGGFKSDMAGAKAQHLAEWARDTGQTFVRFDYSGHGRSEGRFEDGSISRWLGDTLAVIDRLTTGPLVLVGSSMGGWLALRAAQFRPARTAALLLIAPAADFTERLMWPGFTPQQQRQILTMGVVALASAYGPEPTVITREMIEDGRRHLIMDAPIAFAGPVHILQGGQDPDVPAAHVRALADLMAGARLTMQVIADGDHRLSRPQDLAMLVDAANGLRHALAC